MVNSSPADQMVRRIAAGWNGRFATDHFRRLRLLNPIQLDERIQELLYALEQVASFADETSRLTRDDMNGNMEIWIFSFLDNVAVHQRRQLINRLRSVENPLVKHLIDRVLNSLDDSIDLGDSNDDTEDDFYDAETESESDLDSD